MSKARELAELSRTVSDSADSVAITIDSSEDVSFSEDIKLGDGKKAIFGAGSDLQIYHSGSASVISDEGTGNLLLQTNGTAVKLNKGASENMLVANVDGSVDLYYDDVKKLATTSTGIDVTGNSSSRNTIVSNVTLDGGTTVAYPYSGFGFGVNFIGRDYGNAVRNYASINTVMEASSSNSGGGDAGFTAGLSFYTNGGGASDTDPQERLRITGAGAVSIGSGSATARLEVTGAFAYASGANSLATTVSKAAARIRGSSNASTSLFFGSLTNDAEQYIQSSNGAGSAADELVLNPYGGNVSIGSGASISPDADADNLVIQENGAAGITIGSSASSVGSIRFADSGSPRAGMIYYNHVGDMMRFYTNATERLRIDSAGGLTGTMFNATNGEYDGNLNDLKKTGFYRSKSSNTNNPSYAYYSVVVYGNQGNVTAQIATLLAGPATYVRSFNVSWTSWVRIDD